MIIKRGLMAACLIAATVALPPPSPAQLPASPPRRIVADGMPGVNVFTPRRWGVVGVKIANPADRPVEVLSSHYFGDATDFQFGRQLWIPARAVRESWYPVLPPETRTRTPTLSVKSHLIDRASGGETLLGEAGGTLIHEGLLPAHSDTGPVTGFITDPTDPDGALLPQVARAGVNLSPRIARIDTDTLPPTAAALQALDQLVIGNDRIATNGATAVSVRQWLHAGGRLWVQLDRVSPETVALLLGHDFPMTVVDRIGLTKWRIDRQRAVADPDDEAYDSAEKPPIGQPGAQSEGAVDTFEPPVEMVHVVVPGITPVHTVDGWPLSFWVRSGRGLVLFTTLNSRGWVTVRAKGDPAANAQNFAGRFKDTDALRQLATPFLKLRDPSPLNGVSLDPLLVSQVGYRVMSRSIVLGVLTIFCVGLIASSWWLNKRHALAHLGWAGPAVGLVTAGLLVAAGSWSRGRVPPTLSSAQFVEVVPGIADTIVTGRLALYAPDGAPATLGAERGGIFVLDGVAGNRRMVHTDLGRWRWENLALPPGLHTAPLDTSVRLEEPVSARVTFGPDGGIGTLVPGPFRNLEDAILAMPSRSNLAVKLAGDGGSFKVGTEDRLPTGQYLTSERLTGDQQNRRLVYQQLLEQRTWPRYPARPTLLAWASPLDLGFTFVDGARRTGSALVAIPLEVDRPAPGTRVTIPAPFLPYRCVTGPGLSLLYNPRQHEWAAPRSAPARIVLRFDVPRELLPIRVERLRLELNLNARGRKFEVFGGAGSEVLSASTGPTGTVRIELSRADTIQPDATGGIRLGIAVGAGATDEWNIIDLRLELTGQIPED